VAWLIDPAGTWYSGGCLSLPFFQEPAVSLSQGARNVM
jgi:hypothetical protein